MSWLDKLEARGSEARRAVAKRPPPQRSAVQQVVYQVRPQSGGDPGEIDFGFYVIEGDTLILTDISGKPLEGGGDLRRTLGPTDDPFSIAKHLIYLRRKDEGNFNRRLSYPKIDRA
ncbi:hypothetical protein [Bradyrhizobium sp. ORS 86]|uniref:hypothetical protein n=1 Tax=Bradyrhizobium sp. ORS 86 TaxID=1685970 RepID=UPI003890DFA3